MSSINNGTRVREGRSLMKIAVNNSIVRDISDAVGALSYGTITISVRDAKIIQVDVTEKKKFDDVWHGDGAGI